MRRHDSHHCAWWLAEAGSIPKPIPCLFGNAGGRKVLFLHNPVGVFRKERLRGQMYRNFPQKPYGPRAKVETVFRW